MGETVEPRFFTQPQCREVRKKSFVLVILWPDVGSSVPGLHSRTSCELAAGIPRALGIEISAPRPTSMAGVTMCILEMEAGLGLRSATQDYTARAGAELGSEQDCKA